MRPLPAIFVAQALFALALAAHALAGEGWQLARPGWEYVFPRDHGPHPGFRTEWWYFTGNVEGGSGRRYGFQLVFFRQETNPPGTLPEPRSRFLTGDIKLAHFAMTDVAAGRFHYAQRAGRGAFDEAGFAVPGEGGTRLAWNESWSCTLMPGGGFRLIAADAEHAIDLELIPTKPLVIHGADGISRKGGGEGQASHYVSFTRMDAHGTLRCGTRAEPVRGLGWFDHEWATNQLTAEQEGWDWFSLQFDDGTELMLFQLRTREGGIDPYSAGTWVAADGASQTLAAADFELRPTRHWRSPASGARYPVGWEIRVPGRGIALEIRTAVDAQELDLAPIRYWEGTIEAVGTRAGLPLVGRGYLEMTGYGSAIPGLQSPAPAGADRAESD